MSLWCQRGVRTPADWLTAPQRRSETGSATELRTGLRRAAATQDVFNGLTSKPTTHVGQSQLLLLHWNTCAVRTPRKDRRDPCPPAHTQGYCPINQLNQLPLHTPPTV
ncbi:hypothetical protein AAFF_G00224130 [Aldrovandia affinis]|uniref:Uncharacterized protein n=1 Tax=Aldrovandia affinis TaxID=143900 RepID=A0AAD7X268_9TELE|nr:hypothetical protein AAFF_G00224130 [Aldrovandia affinis]